MSREIEDMKTQMEEDFEYVTARAEVFKAHPEFFKSQAEARAMYRDALREQDFSEEYAEKSVYCFFDMPDNIYGDD